MEALHQEFEDVFSDRLMPGKRINMAPVDIQLEEGAKPKAFYHCKQYPLHMAEEAEELVARCQQGAREMRLADRMVRSLADCSQA